MTDTYVTALNNEKITDLLNKEKICINNCFDRVKYINNYDKTYYNLIDINPHNLENIYNEIGNIFTSNTNIKQNRMTGMIIELLTKYKTSKGYTELDNSGKQNFLVLGILNIIKLNEMNIDIYNLTLENEPIDINKKKEIISILETNIKIYKMLQSIFIPYNKLEFGGLGVIAGYVGGGIMVIILLVILIIIIIYLLIYYVIGKIIGFPALIIIMFISSIVTIISSLIKK